MILGLVLLLSLAAIASMVIIAVLLAYIVDPLVTRLELTGVSRTAATAIFFFILLGLVAGVILVLAPIVSDQIDLLRSEDATEQATLILSRLEFAIHKHLGFMGLEQIRLAGIVQTVKQAVREEVLRFVVEDSPSLIAHAVAIPIIMFFFLKDGRDMKKQFVRLVPNRYFEFSLGPSPQDGPPARELSCAASSSMRSSLECFRPCCCGRWTYDTFC